VAPAVGGIARASARATWDVTQDGWRRLSL
jgi:hypothetical protein